MFERSQDVKVDPIRHISKHDMAPQTKGAPGPRELAGHVVMFNMHFVIANPDPTCKYSKVIPPQKKSNHSNSYQNCPWGWKWGDSYYGCHNLYKLGYPYNHIHLSPSKHVWYPPVDQFTANSHVIPAGILNHLDPIGHRCNQIGPPYVVFVLSRINKASWIN